MSVRETDGSVHPMFQTPQAKECFSFFEQWTKIMIERKAGFLGRMEQEFQARSEGKFRVIMTYFRDPVAMRSGVAELATLTEKSITELYPTAAPLIIERAASVKPNEILYVFACDSGLENNLAFVSFAVLNMDTPIQSTTTQSP